MEKQKVIIDCDPGIDDSLATDVGIASDANRSVGDYDRMRKCAGKDGFENAKKVLRHLGRLDVPIYLGAKQPLVKTYVDALDTHGSDGLGESFWKRSQVMKQKKVRLLFFRARCMNRIVRSLP